MRVDVCEGVEVLADADDHGWKEVDKGGMSKK